MELLPSIVICGLALGLLWMACRRMCQTDAVALIGETYLRAAGVPVRGNPEPQAGAQPGQDC